MPDDILVRLGNRVRKERLALGLSQERFAEIANVHRTYVGMIERAEKNITLTNLEKIARALGLEPSELLK